MWKVGGIKTELTRGQNFFLFRQTRKSFNDWFTEAEIFRKTLRHRMFSSWKFSGRGHSELTQSQLSEYLYVGGKNFFDCLWTIVYGKKWFKWASSILKIVGGTFFFTSDVKAIIFQAIFSQFQELADMPNQKLQCDCAEDMDLSNMALMSVAKKWVWQIIFHILFNRCCFLTQGQEILSFVNESSLLHNCVPVWPNVKFSLW